MNTFSLKTILAFSFLLITHVAYASNSEPAKANPATVKQWNQFVDNIYQLHLNHINSRDIKTTARSGSYHDLPYFFQEIKFYDNENNLPISKVEWETKNPDKLHSIEVYIRDKKNRLLREYSASYLPKFRNAPYQTLINLHHYNGELHSFRQYDASDNLIYEVCRSTILNKKLFEHDDYEIPDNFQQGVGKDELYQHCFKSLPRSAELHLTPH